MCLPQRRISEQGENPCLAGLVKMALSRRKEMRITSGFGSTCRAKQSGHIKAFEFVRWMGQAS
jgi:hypothetical protein